MPENFVVDPEGLKNASVPVVRLSELVRGYSTSGQALVSEGPQAWGNDQFGKQFEANFLKIARGVVDAGGELGGLLRDAAEGLQSVAKVFTDANEAAQQTTSRLNGQIGGSTGGRGGSGGGRGRG